jgi:hypothetical protein
MFITYDSIVFQKRAVYSTVIVLFGILACTNRASFLKLIGSFRHHLFLDNSCSCQMLRPVLMAFSAVLDTLENNWRVRGDRAKVAGVDQQTTEGEPITLGWQSLAFDGMGA